MTPEQQVADRLTTFYRQMEQALPETPPPWRPERRRTARGSSWRMQAVATVAVILVAVGIAVLLQHARRHSIVQPVTPRGAVTVPISTARFLNAKDGVVITKRGLLITHDGGQNWQLQTDLQLDWRGINDVRVIDRDHIVIVSSSNGAQFLHSTADGGAHWQTNPIAPVPLRGSLGTLFFLNAREGWQESDSGFTTGKLGPAGTNPKAPDAVALYHTADAGAHWTELWRIGPTQSSSSGPALAGFPSQLFFTDSAHGFMGTTTYDNVGRLYVTRDGGETWQITLIPAPPGGWPSGCCGKVFTSPAVTMFGDRGLVAEGDANRGAVYSTSDGGQSWGNPRLLPTGAVQPYFLTPSHWWALGDSTVYETVDAGASWKHVAVHLPSGLGVLLIDLVTETHVIWGVGGGLLPGVPVSTCLQFFDGPGCNFLIRSTDGGATWTLVKLPAA